MSWMPVPSPYEDGPDFDAIAIVDTIRRCGSITEWVGGFEALDATANYHSRHHHTPRASVCRIKRKMATHVTWTAALTRPTQNLWSESREMERVARVEAENREALAAHQRAGVEKAAAIKKATAEAEKEVQKQEEDKYWGKVRVHQLTMMQAELVKIAAREF